MNGMRQNELLRTPKTVLINSTHRNSGSKLCSCGRVISMNKKSCMGCSDKENV